MLHTRGSVVWGCRVSVGTKRPLTEARVTGRPKDGAFLAVGSPGVFHVQLCSRHYILTELTRASTITSLPIDRALIRRIAAAEAAEIVSPVWACLVFPGFPSRNILRLNRNLGTRNDRVLDARALFDCRALLFRIRGSVLDVEQVSESSYLRVSARERIRQVNLCHGNPAPPPSVRSRRRPNGHARAYRRGTQSSAVSDDPAGALASGGGETWTAQPNSARVRAWVTRVVPVMHLCSAI